MDQWAPAQTLKKQIVEIKATGTIICILGPKLSPISVIRAAPAPRQNRKISRDRVPAKGIPPGVKHFKIIADNNGNFRKRFNLGGYPNHVWSTHIRLARGFVYLMAVLDWYSRKVLAWRVSHTLGERVLCDGSGRSCRSTAPPRSSTPIRAASSAQRRSPMYARRTASPSAVTGAVGQPLVEWLWRRVKYDDVYLRGYTTVAELLGGLTEYVRFYNTKRLHQSLNYVTPDEVYRTASRGGARILDQFGETANMPPHHQTQ